MPDVPPATPPHEGGGKIGSFLGQKTAGLPNWAWLLVIAGGIAFAVIAPKFFKSGGKTTDSNPAGGLGLAIDPTTGLPYAVEGLTATGQTTGGTTTTGTTGGTTTGGDYEDNTQQQSPPPTQQKTAQFQTIDKITSGWGAGAPNIPVRSSPGGSIVGSIGYGKRVIVTGSPINGPNNFGAKAPKGVGSTLWYPVSGGYVSAHDVKQIGAGSTGPAWPSPEIRSRLIRG